MKKVIASAALAAGLVGLTACGTTTVAAVSSSQSYCVNQQTGMVMGSQYCQVGSSFYNPAMFDLWIGNTYGHTYRTGVVIQHNYFVSGRKINPSDSSARKSAGLPVSGSVSNGAKIGGATSKAAQPQNSPQRNTGVSGSTNKSTTSGTRTPSFGGSSGSSTRSSSSFGSSGGGRR